MFKLLTIAVVLAVATAAPAPGGLLGAPAAVAPLAYAAPAALAAPSPVAYHTGAYQVAYAVQPVEQHSYRIAY